MLIKMLFTREINKKVVECKVISNVSEQLFGGSNFLF